MNKNKTLTRYFAIEIRTHPYTAEREVKQTADGDSSVIDEILKI
jgi:hypothetical protein